MFKRISSSDRKSTRHSYTIGNNDFDIILQLDKENRRTIQDVADLRVSTANGTFVNNQRVHGTVLMKHGDELRLDTVRFLLMSPAAEAAAAAQRAPEPPVAVAAPAKSGKGLWVVVAIVVIAAAAAVVGTAVANRAAAAAAMPRPFFRDAFMEVSKKMSG